MNDWSMDSCDVPSLDGASRVWVAWDDELHSYIVNTTTPAGVELPELHFQTLADMVKATWSLIDWPKAFRQDTSLRNRLEAAPLNRLLTNPSDDREAAMASALAS